MPRRLALLLACTLACTLGILLATSGAVAAQSDGNGLEEISVNTYRIDPDAGFVRVEITISLRNVTTDQREGNVIRQRFFDGYGVVVPAGAENVEARSSGGQLLDGELVLDPVTDAFSVYRFDLARNLFAGQSTTVTVTYDHRGLPPRSEIPWRSNAAYSSLVAYGAGDSGDVTIEVVLPFGYTLDEFSDTEGFVRQPADDFGTIVYRAEGLDEDFSALISVSNDDRLIETPVGVGGASFVMESWPGDDEWIAFTADHLRSGVPGLEALIGEEWPVAGELAIRETVEPAFAGYAGWYDVSASEIAVGEELDADTVFHELSHAWFNGDRFDERWLIEGFAQVYAAEMVRIDSGVVRRPPGIDRDDRARVPLQTWSVFDPDETEDYGYPAAWFVVDAIVDEIGFDRMRDVLAAGAAGDLVYGDEAQPGTSFTRSVVDWRRSYDLFELVGGATVVEELYREHVVTDADLATLDDRTAARGAFDTLAREAAPWSVPLGVRRAMTDWRFDEARTEIDGAASVLARRSEVAAVAQDTGVTPPDVAADAFAAALDGYDEPLALLDEQLADGRRLAETQSAVAALGAELGVVMPALGGVRYEGEVDDFDDATAIGRDQLDAMAAVDRVIDTEADTDGVFDRIGLLTADVDRTIDEALAALEAGDTDHARALAREAQAVLDGADGTGRTRALTAGAVTLGVVALVLLVGAGVRRRRRSGGGVIDSDGGVDELGGRRVDLDEDALAGARLGGVDDRVDVTGLDPGEAAGAARVVQGDPVLGHVGDPVLELHEDVGAVVDAEPVSGAEVLIDPDAHDEVER